MSFLSVEDVTPETLRASMRRFSASPRYVPPVDPWGRPLPQPPPKTAMASDLGLFEGTSGTILLAALLVPAIFMFADWWSRQPPTPGQRLRGTKVRLTHKERKIKKSKADKRAAKQARKFFGRSNKR